MIRVYKQTVVPASLQVDNCSSYDGQDVQDALYDDQDNKCYLSEQYVGKDSEIEHLRPKAADYFPELKYKWTNLFLASPYCNGRKSNALLILDPANNNIEFAFFNMLSRLARPLQRSPLWWCRSQQTRASHSCGLVGLPNVGKSLLHQALTKTQVAESCNYPFTTIEPNAAFVSIPDSRLEQLAKVQQSKKLLLSQLQFVDIAGLVKGAHQGAGLGNQFLSNIRDVNVVVHLLRCFDDEDVIHVESSVDAVRDLQILRSELLLADLQVVEKRLSGIKKSKLNSTDRDALADVLQRCSELLEDEKEVFPLQEELADDATRLKQFHDLKLLSAKPVLYVCNVSEDDVVDGNRHTQAVQEFIASSDMPSRCLTVSAQLEADAASFDTDEAQLEYLEAMGIEETGLDKVIKQCKDLLGLHAFYTLGPQEARSWLMPQGYTAVQAAGQIHSDFVRGFIRAECTKPDVFVELGSDEAVRKAGRFTSEGKDYVVEDGDILLFRFNV